MKNILVVIVLLIISQMLGAISKDVLPVVNGPNDCGGYENPLIDNIFSSTDLKNTNKCGKVEFEQIEQKMKFSEAKGPFEISSEPRMCCGQKLKGLKNHNLSEDK